MQKNVFDTALQHFDRLFQRPHAKALEDCFKSMAKKFEDTLVSLEVALSDLAACKPALEAVYKDLGTVGRDEIARAIIYSVGTQGFANYELANKALDAVDPKKNFKRYSAPILGADACS